MSLRPVGLCLAIAASFGIGCESPSAAVTPAPTAFAAPPTELVSIPCPAAIPNCVVLDTSIDGSIVLLRAARAFDSLVLMVGGALRELAGPLDEPGVPIAGAISPDGLTVLFDQGGMLFRYELAAERIIPMPVLGPFGIQWYEFTSATTVALVVPQLGTPDHPTQVVELDTRSLATRSLSSRTDAESVHATSLGVVLEVDTGPFNGAPDIDLYLAAAGGADTLLYAVGPAGQVAVAADGRHVAWSRGLEAWLVNVETGEQLELGSGIVIGFSPDGTLLALQVEGGGAKVVDLEGKEVAVLPDAERAAWVLP